MSPEEERTITAVTAKLGGKVYLGMRFRFGQLTWLVERQGTGDSLSRTMWVARATDNAQCLPAWFTEEEILQRLIP